MLKILFLFLFVIYRSVVFISSLAGYWKLFSFRKSHLDCQSQEEEKESYAFVFPVYREQSIIAETFAYYVSFLNDEPCLKLYFIVDANENDVPSTADILRKLIAENHYDDKVSFLASNAPQGNKANKVNVAIGHLREISAQLPNIFVFDCDARIDRVSFNIAKKWIQRNQADVFSFVPFPTESGKTDLMVEAAMMHHAERISAFELGQYILPRFMRYPMGATLIIRPSLFQYVKALPEPIDDIPLGYLIARLGASSQVLPMFTEVASPPNFRNLLRQHVPIFTGVFSVIITLKRQGIKLRLSDYLICFLLYCFFCAEFFSILFALSNLFQLVFWPLLVIFFQLLLSLTILGRASIKRLFKGLFGYPIRLLLFVFFLLHRITIRYSGNDFKTDRSQ